MKKLMTLAALTLLVQTTGPAAAGGGLVEQPVTKNFVEREVTWTNQTGGMDIRWTMMNMEGRLWVCGALKHKNRNSYMANRAVLRKGWVRRSAEDGKKILKNISFFTQLKSKQSFDGAMATCKATKLKPDTELYYLGFDPHMAYF